jgi:hypothetical protein
MKRKRKKEMRHGHTEWVKFENIFLSKRSQLQQTTTVPQLYEMSTIGKSLGLEDRLVVSKHEAKFKSQ